MKRESPEEKYERLGRIIQNLVLTGYPNPKREGCPGTAAIEDYARRLAAWENMTGQPIQDHVQYCSPCYREFLETREKLREFLNLSREYRGLENGGSAGRSTCLKR